jgi:hypothetical protein
VFVDTDMSVVVIEQCMKEGRHCTVKELAKHSGISVSTVPGIVEQVLKMCMIDAMLL